MKYERNPKRLSGSERHGGMNWSCIVNFIDVWEDCGGGMNICRDLTIYFFFMVSVLIVVKTTKHFKSIIIIINKNIFSYKEEWHSLNQLLL